MVKPNIRARELAEAILDAQIQVGRLTEQMPKAQGARSDKELSNNGVTKLPEPTNITPFPSKEKTLSDAGISKMQASRYETLARNPDIVEEVKAQAREDNIC